MATPDVSVVIPAHNERRTVAWTVESLVETLAVPFEIIVVDDASTDGTGKAAYETAAARNVGVRVLRATEPLGIANSRNRGALEASGKLLVFLDAHCRLLPGWYEQVLVALDRTGASLVAPAVGSIADPTEARGYGVSWNDSMLNMGWLSRRQKEPYFVPLLCGCCQIVRRDSFLELGGYDPRMTRWGMEDHEICLRAWLFGHSVAVAPDAEVLHLFREKQPYEVNRGRVLANTLRCALLHFTGERLEATIRSFADLPYFESSLRRALSKDTSARRGSYLAARPRSDAWYFDELVPALTGPN